MDKKNQVKNKSKKISKLLAKFDYKVKYNHLLEIVSECDFGERWFSINKEDNKESFLFSSKEIQKNIKLNNLQKGQFCFGLNHENMSWELQNARKKSNLFISGAMGSGALQALAFVVRKWMQINSEETILFISDPLKGAYEFEDIIKLNLSSNFFAFTREEENRVIEIFYEELNKRKYAFNSLGVATLAGYNRKKKEKLPFMLHVFSESFHSFGNSLDLNKFEEKGTLEYKFIQILKEGYKYGLHTLAGSQRCSEWALPREIKKHFNHKRICKESKVDSLYAIGTEKPSSLLTDEKGQCYSEEEIKYSFPLVFQGDNLLVIKNLKECSLKPLVSFQKIAEILNNKRARGEEYYSYKSLENLVANIENYNDKIVVSLLHKKMGHKVIEIEGKNESELSCIVEFPGLAGQNSKRVAILICVKNKLSQDDIERLERGMKQNNCSHGIIYSSESSFSKHLYSYANAANIELIDHADWLRLAKKFQ